MSPGWRWLRATALGLAVILAVAAMVYQSARDSEQRRRIDAANELAASASVAAVPAPPTTASPAPSAKAPAPSPSQAATQKPARTDVALPPASFSWPAAGLAVNIVPTDWDPAVPVNPPLDANGFDPVAHWLKGTGQSEDQLPVVLSAHTCHAGVPLCTDSTFPFNRLSSDSWAVGQPASIRDARGTVLPCTLEERSLVDKSKQFSFPNDPCLVVLFTCNFERPDDAITLVTFRCGQCT
ncbi:hypothetical protein GCM10027449_02290 [Sinomonas notoginsengisoli]|uniref:hypothetical protein n=1 Tax=Sinomonas notoginsengisoli TaxID=1457311 RepID=UPI001F402000|nr:hypothetical protein [Sinomonas notoginsengisoli]